MNKPTTVEPVGKSSENSELTPSEGEEQPLEAEIVEPDTAASSEPAPAENGQVLSLVHQPQYQEEEARKCIVHWAILEDNRETSPESRGAWGAFQGWLDNLLTPWGMGSLLLLLVANILLTCAQFSNSRSLTVNSLPPEPSTSSLPPAGELSPSPQLNLAANPPETLNLKSLSTLPPPPKPPVRANIPPSLKVPPATVTPSNSLSNALLPPSLQPQFVQPYTQPYTQPHTQPHTQPSIQPYPVAQPPLAVPPTLPPPPPLQSLSAPSSIQPPPISAEVLPPPSPSQAEPSGEQAVSPASGEQIPPKTDNKDLPPLGAAQKYRLKVQGIQNQTNPNQAMQRLQRLQQQQLQQQ